jgi:hypothetical protein
MITLFNVYLFQQGLSAVLSATTFVKADLSTVALAKVEASPFVRYTEVEGINYQTSGDRLAKKLAKEDLSFVVLTE